MQTNIKIKVLLVDDQPLFVHSLGRVIKNRAEDIEIVGIEENGKEAIETLSKVSVDIVIMDIKMPVMNGIEAAKIISDKYPEINIMMLTTFDEDQYIIEALKYGVKGYLLKNLLPEEVIIAIRALYAGINQISPQIIARLATNMDLSSNNKDSEKIGKLALPQWFLGLTILEKMILKDLVRGMSNKEISVKERLAEQTVKNYLSNIYHKMNINKRSQAVRLYLESNIDNYNSENID